ncbi:hypothetical protein GVX81_04265 [[Haemophilus] felis]|uniref:Lipoprotein n=1 Tax=[Haemophilus] felis TaxID=123822 RepID=A0A1T0AZ09_9PAST|nr:hypothetical protein [[Haemophilus] felis]NBI41876.1 hypothetical protein [[Haemophilus] felis]NBI42493.1 hypothetical protein [[Haemophilus] felis]OOS03193.1 hypothetical protein B0188_06735 [[Haemophilus] felis]
MKKIIQLSIVSILAAFIVACDNADDKTATSSETAVKTDTVSKKTLTKEEQFRKDFERLENWNETAHTRVLQAFFAYHQARVEGDSVTVEKAKQLGNSVHLEVKKAIDELNQLALKDPDVISLAQKFRQTHSVAVDTLDLNLAENTSSKKATEFQKKLRELENLRLATETERNKLIQRYVQ